MKNDKAEKLLACFESIDDDIIAEAVQTVKIRPVRRFSWLSMGNVAAVLVGAVAISCVLMLAFWLGNLGEAPVYHNNNNGHYVESEDTPAPATPTPMDEAIFPYGLPLPRIHGTWAAIVLEAGQTYMTINNPWHGIGHINELPVFLPHMHLPMQGTGNWEMERTEYMTDEEWEDFIHSLELMALGIATFLDIDVSHSYSRRNEGFINWAPRGLDTFMETQFFNSQMRITFPEDSAILPAGTSLSQTAGQGQVPSAIQHLVSMYLPHIFPGTPTPTQAEITLDIGGPRTYYHYRFFDSGGSPTDAILAFNFEWIEILTFLSDRPQWMVLSTFPQRQAESLQLGYFPIITSEEAREMLLEGYFISERGDIEWPGRDAALAASVELVYHTTDTDVIMPMYRFLIADIATPWMGEIPGEWQAFGRYYVPAVHRDYLEPMTRRATPERSTPPSGPRALPPDIYWQILIQGEAFWHPLRFPRHQVEVDSLWRNIMDEIGGLAPNEAYQFRTACGHYAMINGGRNLTSWEEMQMYYPELGLPERVGDFTLREVFVNDRTDFMVVSNEPMPPSAHCVFGPWHHNEEPAPVGEVFTRPLSIDGQTLAAAFYAVYENSGGMRVGFGVSSLFFDMPSGLPDAHSIVDMGEYGLIYFVGSDGEYFQAMYEPQYPWGVAVELWFHHGAPIERRFNYMDLRYNIARVGDATQIFRMVSQEELMELVRIFNPAALAREFQWDLMSWQ
ncbi:MAG: hypothetical protein FWC73_09115 [Defluviitaleaceae bacterium]|nr:hypothetical protein [Defluviitaleaceae bacterium]